MAITPFACSDAARERADPLAATAPPTLRWLLLEGVTGWPQRILDHPDVRSRAGELSAAARRMRGRVLFIRRNGRTAVAEPRVWTVVDATSRREISGGWMDEAGLTDGIAAFTDIAAPSRAARQRYLVCTHGRHDRCCAVRGRPVAAALAAEWPEETWECSHIGGDRFAGNALVLPDGTYYGDLDEVNGRDVIADHRAGRVGAANLRGVSTLGPVAQAALTETLARFGSARLDAMRVTVHDEGVAGPWVAEVSGHPAAGPVMLSVERVVRPARRLRCLATIDQVAVTYECQVLGERI